MREEKINSDVVNAREFLKGAYTALAKVVELIGDCEEDSVLWSLELKVVDLQDRVLNQYLEIVRGEWSSHLEVSK